MKLTCRVKDDAVSRFTRAVAGLLLMALPLVSPAAESYPTRPIRLVNPYAPGGSVDVFCRAIAHHLSGTLGQRIIVDNRPGAGTNIGTEIVVRAQPDGHTLLCNSGAIAINPSFYPNLPFRPLKDLTAVALVVQSPVLLAVHPSVPARSARELIDLARAKPGQITFASSGVGSSVHLALELFKSLTKVDIAHVPYKGGGQSLLDLVAGQVHGSFNTPPTLMPHVKAGRLRALGMGTLKRSEFAPDMPTLVESGVAGYDASVWYAVFAPSATPRAVMQRWNDEINRMLQTAEVREQFFASGMSPLGGSIDEAHGHFVRETARWSTLIREARISLVQ